MEADNEIFSVATRCIRYLNEEEVIAGDASLSDDRLGTVSDLGVDTVGDGLTCTAAGGGRERRERRGGGRPGGTGSFFLLAQMIRWNAMENSLRVREPSLSTSERAQIAPIS